MLNMGTFPVIVNYRGFSYLSPIRAGEGNLAHGNALSARRIRETMVLGQSAGFQTGVDVQGEAWVRRDEKRRL